MTFADFLLWADQYAIARQAEIDADRRAADTELARINKEGRS